MAEKTPQKTQKNSLILIILGVFIILGFIFALIGILGLFLFNSIKNFQTDFSPIKNIQSTELQDDRFSVANNKERLNSKQQTKTNLDFEKLELADKQLEIMTGLMYRDELCENCGMLFEFQNEQIRSFWMKNTKIPLDMIFLDENGKIVKIHTNTEPLREDKLYSSELPILYVLEASNGYSQKQNLTEGLFLNLDYLLDQTVPFDKTYLENYLKENGGKLEQKNKTAPNTNDI
jgi:uncharacterized membrane protein (UPF0127 family)